MARLCKQLFQKALFPVEENGDVYDRCTYEEALRQAWNDDGGEGASPEDQMPLADRAQRDGLRSPTPPSDDELEKAEGELLTSGVEVADNEHYSSGRDTLEEEGGTAGDAFAVRIEDRKMWFHSDNDNRTASPMPKGTQEGRRGSMHTNEGSDMEISFPERTPTHEVKRRLLCSSEESHQAVESTSAAVSSLYAKFGKADAGGNQGARTGAPEGGEVGVARVTTDNGKEKEDRADKGASVEEPEEPVRALALKEKAGKQDRGREKGEESDAHKGGHRREEQHRNSSTTDPDARGQSGKGAHDDRKEVEQGRSREEQNATYGQQEESKKANKKKRKAEKTNKQASGESFLDIDGDEGEDNEVSVEDAENLDKCNMPLCSICDDGGELILCEGVCMRSFHPKDCLDMDEVPDRQWYCPHCRLHVQPCAFCKKEDKSFGSDKKVYKCAEYTCGCYYHPDHLPGDSKRLLMEGQWFCYRHFCSVCGQFELNASKLVKCLLCLETVHAQCLDRSKLPEYEDEFQPRRLWLSGDEDGELGMSVMYCTRHHLELYYIEDEEKGETFHWLARGDGVDATRVFSQEILDRAKEFPWDKPSFEGMAEHSGAPKKTSFHSEVSKQHKNEQNPILRPEDAKVPRHRVHTIRRNYTAEKRNHEEKAIEAETGQNKLYRPSDEAVFQSKVQKLDEERRSEIDGHITNAQKQLRAHDPKNAANLLPPRILQELMAMRIHTCREVAPYAARQPYVGFERMFLKRNVLGKISAMCIEYVKHGDCIVDFSCGDNAWISSMIERSEEKGLDFLTFKGYDTILVNALAESTFSQRDFLEVKPSELPEQDDKVVMGLHPPGTEYSHQHLNEFLSHAVRFSPRVFFFVVPVRERLDALSNYTSVFTHSDIVDGQVYRVPGSYNPNTQREVYVEPTRRLTFKVLVRNDCLE